MQLKINTSITLSTGHTATAAVVELFNENFLLQSQEFKADLRAWKTQADKDAGKDHTYLFEATAGRIVNLTYAIPQADLDQANTDGHFGVIGTNHPTRIKDEIAAQLGILATDITITSLV